MLGRRPVCIKCLKSFCLSIIHKWTEVYVKLPYLSNESKKKILILKKRKIVHPIFQMDQRKNIDFNKNVKLCTFYVNYQSINQDTNLRI